MSSVQFHGDASADSTSRSHTTAAEYGRDLQ
jgi:hypothetical protein